MSTIPHIRGLFTVMCKSALLVSIATVLLASCERTPQHMPSAKELASKFASASAAFEQLSQMIRADSGKRNCFVVGLDTMGEFGPNTYGRGYWEIDGEWFNERD